LQYFIHEEGPASKVNVPPPAGHIALSLRPMTAFLTGKPFDEKAWVPLYCNSNNNK
jgi:hypothetical protein